jgi:ATP-binding cassette subfamily B protein/subfamily B ATP-binding cassette protein MsbA
MLDRQPTIADPLHPRPVPPGTPDVLFDKVNFHYEPGRPVLRDISLRLRHGETLAIVGPNGCGKTTLANLIPRFYDPVSGAIRLGGVDLRELKLRDLRRRIGMVTQQTVLFDDTIRDNIRYGALHASDEEVVEAAKKAHLHRFIESLENGYDTNVGERGGRLSGGQRQRIALARAILRNPAILILDEATSEIDPESERMIHIALESFIRDRTTIVITHRMSTLALADRILVMDDGAIADMGVHDELMGRCPLYRRLRRTDFKLSA